MASDKSSDARILGSGGRFGQDIANLPPFCVTLGVRLQEKEGEEMRKKFSKLDAVLLVAIIVIYTPLSLWGGSERWAGDTDALPLIMLGIGAAYVVFECIRLCSPAVCPILGGLVPLFTIGPSLFLYPKDIGALPAVVAVGYMFGLLMSAICWAVKDKTKASISSWGFWLGIHSLFLSLLALPAIICGHIALARLQPAEVIEKKRAKIGLAIGYGVFGLMLFGVIILAANA